MRVVTISDSRYLGLTTMSYPSVLDLATMSNPSYLSLATMFESDIKKKTYGSDMVAKPRRLEQK
jgi:hypothetical protein